MIHKNLALLILVLLPTTYISQFDSGKHIVGPSLGFSFLGSALQIGINHEYGIDLKELGITEQGKFGIGGVFRYWTYSENFVNIKTEYTDILLGIQNNYHFYLMNEKVDPWVGLVLAYDFGSFDTEIKNLESGNTKPSRGGFWIGAHAGLRYWIKDNISVNVRIGFGTLNYGALDLGFDYRID